jgi:two-component system OmpR family sensor kinase
MTAFRMSLRTRLVVLVIALLAAGLVLAAGATLAAMRFFLLAQTDTRLDQLSSAMSVQVRAGMDVPRINGGRVLAATGQPFVLMRLVAPDGTVRVDLGPPAAQSARIDVRPDDPTDADPEGVVHENVRLPGVHPAHWRVRAAWLADGRGFLLLGLPMTEFQTVSDRLIRFQVVTTLVVLALVTVVAFRVIRTGMRPLDDIAKTAGAIGAGDLNRRIRPAPPNTEIGRLSDALNAMLGQISTAFRERRESEDRLRRFIADASHELNTPIATIRGYAELFRHGAAGDPAELAVAMHRIESEATRMGQLAGELLTLVKLDEGRPLERLPVDLAHLAAEAAADARAIEPDRPLTVEAPAPVVVSGDDARLRQLLTNLLSNVRRHTPPGTPAVVRVRATEDDATIEVADEGPGMTQDDAERVFERFYRTAETRSRQRSGSGLGLAIVASIAEAHGGTATVDSAPGTGTTFTVRLPRRPAEPSVVPDDQPRMS